MPDGDDVLRIHDVPAYARAILDALAALTAKVDALAAAQSAPSSRDASDAALLKSLFPAVAGLFASARFLAADLADDEQAFPMLRGWNAMQIGGLLGANAGEPIGGFLVERDGKGWRLLATSAT